jgi:Holliday junction resolvase RusA-like endonuclease
MGHVISLVIPGKPISKDNRRFPAIRRGAPVIKIPETYRDFEKRVKVLALEQILRRRDRARFPIPRPTQLVMHLMFFYPYEPTGNDVYNAPKSICDALQGVLYDNDNQILIGMVAKAKDDGGGRIEVVIEDPPEDVIAWWRAWRAAIEDGQQWSQRGAVTTE